MEFAFNDAVARVEPGAAPNYNKNNPLAGLLGIYQATKLAAEREHYWGPTLQHLFPVDWLELHGPAGADADLLNPVQQTNKEDFQKQNIKQFRLGDTYLARGYVTVGDWTGPFLRISYQAGPDSRLSQATGHTLGQAIWCWVRVGPSMTQDLIRLPYREDTARYEVELWGYPGNDLNAKLDHRGRQAFQRGEIVARPDLIHGVRDDFSREALDMKNARGVAPDHTMHPVLPLPVELAFASSDGSGATWDSQGGANYRYAFNMRMRGFNSALAVGMSANPHGGVGFLEYRNLFSNYFAHKNNNELGRALESWRFDADGNLPAHPAKNGFEPFMSVDYMDLHILKPGCGIGIHRHRDNAEAFLMMRGQGLMIVGDWCRFPEQERAFEIRTMLEGDIALLVGGQLHALMNTTEEDCQLFMFGGYD